jgi:hypothetical protein
METKQTAVEYIVNVVNSCSATNYIPNEIVNQAKQMEKEQISRAYQEGLIDGMNHSPKEYYNETYGQN